MQHELINMWWRTYYRLQRRAQAAEDRSADDFIIAAGCFLSALDFISSILSTLPTNQNSSNINLKGQGIQETH